MFKLRPAPIAAAIAASQLFMYDSVPVYAQPILEEVVVTARKREESLMDTPLSVTAVQGETMDATGVTNMEQLAAQVPSLNIGRSAQSSTITIRGVGSGGANRGFEQSVGMFLDGIYQPRARQFTQSLVDLERVEVLRGPQSILFGKNTIAGAIKVESRSAAPGEEFNGSITVDMEPEYSTARGTAVLSGSLSDNFAARLAARYQETDGYVDNQLRGDEESSDDTMARLSLVWQASDTVEVEAKFSYLDSETDGIAVTNPVVDFSLLQGALAGQNNLAVTQVLGTIGAQAVAGFGTADDYKSYVENPSWQTAYGFKDSLETESSQVSLGVAWDLGDYTLNSLTGYTDFSYDQIHDTDYHGANIANNIDSEDLEQFSQEFRVSSNYDGRFNFVAGAYYEEQDLDIISAPLLDGSVGGVFGQLPAAALNPGLPAGLTLSDLGINSLWSGAVLAAQNPAVGGPLVGAEQEGIGRTAFNEYSNETWSVFLELAYDITETLSLELGARYADDTKDDDKSANILAGVPAAPIVVQNPDGSFTGELDAQNSALVATWMAAGFNTFVHDAPLSRSEDHLLPSARLTWNYSDEGMAYLSYSEGYKSGGFNATADTFNPDGTPGDGTEFEDEESEAWELGVKTSLWDGRARLGAALFYTEISNLQVTSFQGVAFLVGNAAESTNQGFELDTQIALTDTVEVGGALTYLDAEYDAYPGAPCTIYQIAETGAGCSQDLAGETPPNAPEWAASVYGSYENQISSRLWLNARLEVAYKDEMYLDGDLDPNLLQDETVMVNARIGITGAAERWEVALYGRNLTDETTIGWGTDAPLSAGIYAGWVAEPRVLGVQARYNF